VVVLEAQTVYLITPDLVTVAHMAAVAAVYTVYIHARGKVLAV
jgi:hypothetical protein